MYHLSNHSQCQCGETTRYILVHISLPLHYLPPTLVLLASLSMKSVTVLLATSDYTGPVPTSMKNFTNFLNKLQTYLESVSTSPVPTTTPPSPTTMPDYVYIVVGALGAVLLVVCLMLTIAAAVIAINKQR